VIHFHGGPTPNAQKVAILLEELGAPYTSHLVDTARGDQRQPAFLAINPNGKLPAIVDHGQTPPLALGESGAILCYLAERHGRFMPADPAGRAVAMQWLMWQMSALGPTGGQMSYFGRHCEVKLPLVLERFALELHRQLQVLNTALGQREYVAGAYSIADMAIYPWWVAVRQVPVLHRRFRRAHWLPWFANLVRSDAPQYAHIEAWASRVAARPAVARGMAAFTAAACC
jgi:GST-like protein